MSAASARVSSESSVAGHSTRTRYAASVVKDGDREGEGELCLSAPPPYLVFRCDWSDCGAELHNLETLRKHVYRVHVARKSARCQWDMCRVQCTLTPGALRKHIENEHIEPVAMKLGDGPSSIGHGLYETVKDKVQSKAFLFDEHGSFVTPEAGPNDDDPPAIIFAAPPMAVHDFNVLHNHITRQHKCQAVVDALAAKKIASGISMTKDGCTFMNYDRLHTVAAFETVYETFQEDEPPLLKEHSKS
ncbi:hypothetical protein KEM54_003518 [Ascosphaera aggregata]|nr:hypothetical protein KEM54_003518 [Ascosphaera aggregata]